MKLVARSMDIQELKTLTDAPGGWGSQWETFGLALL